MTDGMLEYLIVTEMGKTHESLLSTKIEPYDIQVAMLLLGIEPAGKADAEPPAQITKDYLKGAPGLKGETINVYVVWQDAQEVALPGAEFEDRLAHRALGRDVNDRANIKKRPLQQS